MKDGQWIANSYRIGKIKEMYSDGVTADIYLYDRNGNKIGRESPAMGGPTKFEPACDLSQWKAIKTPVFPLSRFAYIEDIVDFL
jgi:hypothetical protein